MAHLSQISFIAQLALLATIAIIQFKYAQAASTLESIGKFPIDVNRITLSGVSAGGTMAQTMQISHSKLFSGIATFSHTFYRCGVPDGDMTNYDQTCTSNSGGSLYPVGNVWNDIENYKEQGLIDDPVNLKNKRLYVYAGLDNELFRVDQGMSVVAVYEPFIQNPKAIKTRVQSGGLIMPTNGLTSASCVAGDGAQIGDCKFSGAYEALEFLINGDEPGSSLPIVEPARGKSVKLAPLLEFDQRPFTRGLDNPLLGSTGYIYIPTSGCKNKCLLHFFFHGCSHSKDSLERNRLPGSAQAANSGFLELAELNNMIVVFPQHVAQQGVPCWDTYGIRGPLYATKKGLQVIAIKRMLDHFLQ